MKARLIINEIRQDRESGLGALGVGRVGMHRGYDYIQKTWEHLLTPLQKSYGLFYPVAEEKVPDIKLFIPKVLNLMNCKPEEVILLNAHNLLTGFAMFDWIDNIMENAEINISNKITTKIHKLIYDISYDIQVCEDFDIAELHIESNELRDDGSKIDALDVFHPIFIKYR